MNQSAQSALKGGVRAGAGETVQFGEEQPAAGNLIGIHEVNNPRVFEQELAGERNFPGAP